MLNIPWYAWLNIISLLLVWVLHSIGTRENHSILALTWANHFKILTLIFFIFLNWNQTEIFELTYYLIAIAIAVTILVGWDILSSIAELFIPPTPHLFSKKQIPPNSSSEIEIITPTRVFDVAALDIEHHGKILTANFMFICLISTVLIPPVYIAIKLSIGLLLS